MPLPGGPADKFGNRYEGRWTVVCMAEVLAEQASYISLEPIDEAVSGAEFRLAREGVLEYHQVKRQTGRASSWTMASLRREGVLAAIRAAVGSPDGCFAFVSMVPATQLRELAERARSVNSLAEFRVAIASNDYDKEFACLARDWDGMSAEGAWSALQRVSVRTIDEESLRVQQRAMLMPWVDGDPDLVADTLAQFALDSVGRDLSAADIWNHLRKVGLHPRKWDRDPRVLTMVSDQAERYRRQANDVLIGGKLITRSEVGDVLGALTRDDGPRTILLAGNAGCGKSAVLANLVDEISDVGWPLLAFRVDRLEAVIRPEEVGDQLGLPGSPASVLAAVAVGGPALLIVDQLDAVSLASGRQPTFFDCVSEVIRQAEVHHNLRLVIACRLFDLENDHRLRRLREDPRTFTIELGALSDDQVLTTLVDLGIEPSGLSAAQRQLLRIPLHMALLAQARRDGDHPASFASPDDLYAGFWDAKQLAVRDRLRRPARWTEVIDATCEYMSEHEVLSVPLPVLDTYRDDVAAMTSENVLVADGDRRAFFHESFFDYAFARRFAARGQDLPSFLRQAEQHLFRRAQLRQILQHERAISRDDYVRHLSSLLSDEDIRFHLKQVVLAFLGTVQDPTASEWKQIAPLLDSSPDPSAAHTWGLLRRSPAWFDLVDTAGDVGNWLDADDQDRADEAVILLAAVQRERPDRVASLLMSRITRGGRWVDRFVHVVLRADLTISREFFELFLALLDNGTLDGITTPFAMNGSFWDLAHGLVESKPSWAAEFASHYLKRRLQMSLDAGEINPFEGPTSVPDPIERGFFTKAAQGDPGAFLTELLPFVLRVLTLNAPDGNDGIRWRDPIWSIRWRDTDYGVQHGLLGGVEEALRLQAEGTPDQLERHLTALEESGLETAAFLMCRALTAAGPQCANRAVDFLLGDSRRMQLGYADEMHWATRELIEAVSLHCDPSHLHRLEAAVLDYYPDWERTAEGRRRRGYAQYVLLGGWDRGRMSGEASGRFEEWRRKFLREPEGPHKIEVSRLGPAVPREAAERLSDEHWLQAIAKHPHDDEFGARDYLRRAGGAHALASEIHDEVVRDPVRFARLMHRIPNDANAAYFSDILRGLRDTEEPISADLIFDACRRCHSLPGRPCGRWITGPIEKFAADDIPEDILELVAWYTTEDPDPADGLWAIGTSSESEEYSRDLITAGMNSARGSAALSMARIIRENGARIADFRAALDRLVRDADIAVRSCAAETLISVLVHNEELAVGLFCQLGEDVADDLLATRTADRFLYYAVRNHFDVLRPTLERMLASEREDVATAGARHACLASLESQPAADLVKAAIEGTPAMRLGAAQVYAANLGDASLRDTVTAGLTSLFNDDDSKVRDEAGTCFRTVPVGELDAVADVIDAYADSAAIADNHLDVLRALEETTCELPATSLKVCRRLIQLAGPALGDIRTSWSAQADEINKIVLRVYAQSRDPEVQGDALDLIDGIVATGAYGIDKALAEYERQ